MHLVHTYIAYRVSNICSVYRSGLLYVPDRHSYLGVRYAHQSANAVSCTYVEGVYSYIRYISQIFLKYVTVIYNMSSIGPINPLAGTAPNKPPRSRHWRSNALRKDPPRRGACPGVSDRRLGDAGGLSAGEFLRCSAGYSPSGCRWQPEERFTYPRILQRFPAERRQVYHSCRDQPHR